MQSYQNQPPAQRLGPKNASLATLQNKHQQQSSKNNTPDKQSQLLQQKKKASIKKPNNQNLKENNESHHNQYMMGVLEQRKKSLEIQLQYSKSTKVSPNRVQVQVSQDINQKQQQQPLRVNTNQQNTQMVFDNSFQNKAPTTTSLKYQENNNINNIASQYSLRIPMQEKEQINRTPQFDIDSLSPTIISHTTQFPQNSKFKSLVQKDSQVKFGSQYNGDPEHTFDRYSIGDGSSGNGSSNIHQSFINLIYPSMSKKIMTNNQDAENSKAQGNQVIKNQVQGVHHHQKSKSLFTGGPQQNGLAQFQNQNLMNQGVQKVNQSSYKKQSNVFNYSQRLKELLNDNSDCQENSNDDNNPQQSIQQNFQRKHQIFSQQPSPSNSHTNILLNMNDVRIDLKQVDSKKTQSQVRSTFDNIVQGHNQFSTIEEQIKLAQSKQGLNQQSAQTIDIYLNNRGNNLSIQNPMSYQQMKSNTQTNTPNNNFNNQQNKPQTQMNFKTKQDPQSSKAHTRKSSQNGSTTNNTSNTLMNNFIAEDSLQSQSFVIQNEYQAQMRASSRRNSNCPVTEQQQQIHQQNYPQQQQHQPTREKKQHQPTQGKILHNHKQQQQQQQQIAPHHHQRSSSDYIQFNAIQQQNANPTTSNSKGRLKKYLNSDSQGFDISQGNLTIQCPNQLEVSDDCKDTTMLTTGTGITPKCFLRDGEKSSGVQSTSFLQQYSQALIEAQIQINKQYQLNGIQSKQTKKQGKLSFVDNPTNTSQTIHQTNNNQNNEAANSKSIYHQRKLSYQHNPHPSQQLLHNKKSPLKQTTIQPPTTKDSQYQKMALKRKISPKPNTNHHHLQQFGYNNNNTSRPQIQSNNVTSKSNAFNQSGKSNISATIKNHSQITSPTMHHQNNISHQIQSFQNSLSNSHNKFKQIVGQHNASASTMLQSKDQCKSSKDLKTKIIQQATKKYQDQLTNKQSQQSSTNITHGKLNLQGMTSQIRKNIAQSERTSPRIPSANTSQQNIQQPQHQSKKSVANVSIDLYKGSMIVHQQQNLSFISSQQQQHQQHNKQYSKISLQKSDSQTLQNEFFARKNSFLQLNQNSYANKSNGMRDESPINMTNIQFNQSALTIDHTHNNNYQHHHPSSTIGGNTKPQHQHSNSISGHRYSVQNSPQKNLSIFQKSIKNSHHHQKTSSMSNIMAVPQQQQFYGPQSSNFSNYQQQKPQQITILSPQPNNISSYSMMPSNHSNMMQNSNSMHHILEVSANTPVEPLFLMQDEQDNNSGFYGKNLIGTKLNFSNQQKQQQQQTQKSMPKLQLNNSKQNLQHNANNSYQQQYNQNKQQQQMFQYELSQIQDFKQSANSNNGQKLTETEQLLNQIRSNILKQKNYNFKLIEDDSSPSTDFIDLSDSHLQNQQPSKNSQLLCKITENSVEQFALETAIDLQRSERRQTAFAKKEPPPPLQINNAADDSQTNFMYMTTDPSLSPYSKDIYKLQKMITLNFKKYNQPPLTTSEFYRIGRVLGRGAFGKVNLAAHKVSEQLVAIKSINKEFLKSEEDQKKKIMQEFAILKQSNHKSVVRLYDTFETNKHICFVMELCSGGDLLTYVRKRRKLKEDVAKYFFKQIIEGLAYIHHSKLIVHRDIKLDNILLDANGRIKICDFGVSRQVSSETERMSEQCGTPAYIAPEILKDKGYEGFKVDVWSAGVCLYAMLIGTVPFKAASMHELHHLIINGKYEIKEEKLSDSALNLIAALLEVDHRKRLSAFEVLSHPWLKDAQDEMDIFTQKEKDTITREYLSKNIDRARSSLGIGHSNVNSNQQNNNNQQQANMDTEVIFTEHNLDTKTNGNSMLKNASTKSIILAPFNSTVSDFDEEKEKYTDWPDEVKQMMVPKKCIKFAPKCKDLDRQYEQNNNADLDNGVYNQFANDNQSNKSGDGSKSNKSHTKSQSSSQDSLKKSFKETELSSDDEKAEKQVEQAREQQLNQQSELQEFEKQIKNSRYIKYQEPVEIIDEEIIKQIVRSGLYPQDYLMKVLNTKEMNYATATYHLLLKKQFIIQKLFSENNLNSQQLEQSQE